MKIPVGCMQCLTKNMEMTSYPIIDNINEQDYYEVKCEHGHTNYYYFQNEKFDILFTLAIQALCDGYNREAYLNFVASLERFYEFGVRLMTKINGTTPEDYATLNKQLNSNSERELGAYCSLFLATKKEPAKILTNSQRNYRNRVVHQGVSPSRVKTVELGESVYNLIRNDFLFFNENYPNVVNELCFDRQRQLREKTKKPLWNAVIFSYIDSSSFLSIDDMIKQHSDMNKIIHDTQKALQFNNKDTKSVY